MKIQNITFLIFLITATTFGQRSHAISLESFTALKVYDRIEVSLVKSDENRIVISGDNKNEVAISQNEGLLKIKMELDNFLQGNNVKAILYYTEELQLLDANENAKIISTEVYKGTKADIRGQEGGIVVLKVALDFVNIRAISGSEITLTGQSTVQEIAVNTGGKVYNETLDTSETIVTVLAGGSAHVKASSKVIAKVKAGGIISIYGNPESIESNKVFGGTIKIID